MSGGQLFGDVHFVQEFKEGCSIGIEEMRSSRDGNDRCFPMKCISNKYWNERQWMIVQGWLGSNDGGFRSLSIVYILPALARCTSSCPANGYLVAVMLVGKGVF